MKETTPRYAVYRSHDRDPMTIAGLFPPPAYLTLTDAMHAVEELARDHGDTLDGKWGGDGIQYYCISAGPATWWWVKDCSVPDEEEN